MNQTPNVKYKRRNYYIDKQFQTKFIAEFCLIVALGSLLAVAMVYWLAHSSTTVAIVDGKVGVHTTAEYLLPILLQTVAIELVVVAIATIVMTIFISHKIAGPLYRFKRCFEDLGNGNLSAVHLRQDDQLKEVAVAYNEAVHKLNDKIKLLRNSSSIEEVKKILDTFKIL